MADSLHQMLVSYGNTQADTLYYEILDLPLEEFEKVKTVKVNHYQALLFVILCGSLYIGNTEETSWEFKLGEAFCIEFSRVKEIMCFSLKL